MLICGIEEAGRGPVVGPMVMCGIVIDEINLSKFKEIGAKDSKLLTRLQREKLFEKIKKTAKAYEIILVSAQEIDEVLESDSMNLNWLEAKYTAEIINKLNPVKVILDCPSNNIKEYTRYVKKLLKNNVEIIAEHKADVNHPIVGAASILAKVTRDREIDKIKKDIKIDFGSGYPSDPKTAEFLKKNWNKYPEIFRKNWYPYKKVVLDQNQKKMGEF